ncbi:Hydroxymethylpyrimidine ABC transporter, substrate-binding component [Olavius algarvensis associated proteobacterium Delta 3]|nr:Hydroxymethylpyrimidine ABC transporter, substrate-binding component [Olavius algarvensis associated proteobacterium Delta 3]CAB5164938.1 Hydroxymethylpyrimidine ABC transporter, substrate-binding component [Olavius algarvensis associated proteobacterium Delta 3]
MKRLFCSLMVILMILLPVPGITAERLTLMLDWFPNVDHLPIYLAQQRGDFAARGLEIRIVSPSDTADALKLAASGHVDMAVSYEPQAIIAASEGLTVRVFGRLIEHPLTTLLFLRNRGIEAPRDLIGKRIGYTVPGLMDVLLEAFAKINGIDDYTAINVGFTIAQSLTAGRVDAIMGPFKTYETVVLDHLGYNAGYFELEKWGIPDYDELVFVCGTAAATRHRAALQSFVEAVQVGIDLARQDPANSLEAYLKAVPEADRRTETEAFRLTLPYYASHQRLSTVRWQQFADFALRHDLIERPVNVDHLLLQETE